MVPEEVPGEGQEQMPQDRAERIIETAVELAEQGGFEAVRLRDVASNAGVALGTLYRHFRSKEDLLMAALSREVQVLLAEFVSPPPGDTPIARVRAYFTTVTHTLCLKPKLARAVLRSAASGEPELTGKLNDFNDVLSEMVVSALRGEQLGDARPSEVELRIGELLHMVWFSALLSWMSGRHDEKDVVDRVCSAADLMIEGAGIR